jgi:hypothetical protein
LLALPLLLRWLRPHPTHCLVAVCSSPQNMTSHGSHRAILQLTLSSEIPRFGTTVPRRQVVIVRCRSGATDVRAGVLRVLHWKGVQDLQELVSQGVSGVKMPLIKSFADFHTGLGRRQEKSYPTGRRLQLPMRATATGRRTSTTSMANTCCRTRSRRRGTDTTTLVLPRARQWRAGHGPITVKSSTRTASRTWRVSHRECASLEVALMLMQSTRICSTTATVPRSRTDPSSTACSK